MPSLSNVRPQRSHVFPFAVTASALLWFVNRDAETSGIAPRTVTLGVASVVGRLSVSVEIGR